ncbi:hypothetical protein [Massilia phyllosphaerae]|uniref:hypothetical protein n=1 Tax=Massilia phyllosphaerae TaxID=3106034 RepID=UPI002B1CAC04|nr:hypothetical protein [Massilia sp. SGZ-792]
MIAGNDNGIGSEVIPEVRRVPGAAARRFGLHLELSGNDDEQFHDAASAIVKALAAVI